MYREISLSKMKSYSNTWDINDKICCYKFSPPPWRRLNGTIFIAVSNIDDTFIKLLKEKYNNNFILFKSDCNRVIDFLKTFFSHVEFLKNYFYYKSTALCKLIKSPQHWNKTKRWFYL